MPLLPAGWRMYLTSSIVHTMSNLIGTLVLGDLGVSYVTPTVILISCLLLIFMASIHGHQNLGPPQHRPRGQRNPLQTSLTDPRETDPSHRRRPSQSQQTLLPPSISRSTRRTTSHPPLTHEPSQFIHHHRLRHFPQPRQHNRRQKPRPPQILPR